jgi:hypothetical protein
MEQRFGAALAETRASTFRSAANVSSATGLAHYLGAELGMVEPSDLTWEYVDTSGRFAGSHYAELARGASVDTFCCNDSDDDGTGEHADAGNAALERFLSGYFPTPSRFETGTH